MDVLIKLNRRDGHVGKQIESGVRQLIRRGALRPGDEVPSTRAFAAQLAVSRGLVQQAYDQLTSQGYLVARRGSGTRVALGPHRRTAAADTVRVARARDPKVRYDFLPGVPDSRLFPIATWLRGLRRGLARDAAALEYPNPAGWPPTRDALASYLNRARATDLQSGHVLLCSGFAQAVRLIASALRSRGLTRVGVEDPSYALLSGALHSAGVDVVPIPLDDEGLRVDVLARRQVDAVLVTPAHQYPTGIAMSSTRRAALLQWAATGDRYILEDDYDSEYRYDRSPVGALQGVMPDRVVYMGTASKMLAPGLRLGWLGVPPSLLSATTRSKREADGGSPVMDQVALGEFIADGELDKHMRRTRLEYRARRDALMDALAHQLPGVAIRGSSAGLHLLLPLKVGTNEEAVIESCAALSVRVLGAKRHYAHPNSALPGLVLGYGHLKKTNIGAGLRIIAGVIEQ